MTMLRRDELFFIDQTAALNDLFTATRTQQDFLIPFHTIEKILKKNRRPKDY